MQLVYYLQYAIREPTLLVDFNVFFFSGFSREKGEGRREKGERRRGKWEDGSGKSEVGKEKGEVGSGVPGVKK